MDSPEIIAGIKNIFPHLRVLSVSQPHPDELELSVGPEDFKDACLALHKILVSPVMMMVALDERAQSGNYLVNCIFVDIRKSRWITVAMKVPQQNAVFESLAKNLYSANLFEREICEMFGIEAKGNPDLRSLNLHEEVCPAGNYPLRKDFTGIQGAGNPGEYKFSRVDGGGIFEVPVGPVHAGIIGPGHFRFSVAGEPIINLEARLGFTHRGVEKLFEGKEYAGALRLAECVTGDSCFSHSLAFTHAAEKICGAAISKHDAFIRAILLELERMYNHINDIGGIATDVGFSFPAAYASIVKEALLQINEELTGNRYLKQVNILGGVVFEFNKNKKDRLCQALSKVMRDFNELTGVLESSVSFMDRVDTTGVLKRKTAEDLGVIGLAARASGIALDLRKYFPGVYQEAKFKMITRETGDVLARLEVRMREFEESVRLIRELADKIPPVEANKSEYILKAGQALGFVEGWRGPVLYWLKTNDAGRIERCKIVDASFHNWQGLCFAVLGDIIPDFPICNKSFDLSYPGNDL